MVFLARQVFFRFGDVVFSGDVAKDFRLSSDEYGNCRVRVVVVLMSILDQDFDIRSSTFGSVSMKL
jgi:hypothetical protein